MPCVSGLKVVLVVVGSINNQFPKILQSRPQFLKDARQWQLIPNAKWHLLDTDRQNLKFLLCSSYSKNSFETISMFVC